MKNFLPAAAIVFVMLWDFVVAQFSLPKAASYATDVVVFAAGGAALLRLIATKQLHNVPIKYVVLMVLFFYGAVSAYAINAISGDVIFAGVRTYLRYPVFFLVGLAYVYTDADITRQLKVVLAVMFLQIPLSIWQRFFEFKHLQTGDVIVGSFSTSTTLALLCSCAIVMVVAFVIDKRIAMAKGILLCLLLLIPAAISETKATPIFLIAGIFAMLFARRGELKLPQLIGSGLAVVVVLTMFVAVYDVMYKRDLGYLDLVTSSDRMLGNYNMHGSKAESFERYREIENLVVDVKREAVANTDVGRLDSVSLPLQAFFPDEPMRLMVGLGPANIDTTFRSGAKYGWIKEQLGGSMTTLSMLLWETGLLGVAVTFSMILLLAFDAYRLNTSNSVAGSMGLGVFGVLSIATISLVYANLLLNVDFTLMLTLFLSFSVGCLRRERQQISAAPTGRAGEKIRNNRLRRSPRSGRARRQIHPRAVGPAS